MNIMCCFLLSRVCCSSFSDNLGRRMLVVLLGRSNIIIYMMMWCYQWYFTATSEAFSAVGLQMTQSRMKCSISVVWGFGIYTWTSASFWATRWRVRRVTDRDGLIIIVYRNRTSYNSSIEKPENCYYSTWLLQSIMHLYVFCDTLRAK